MKLYVLYRLFYNLMLFTIACPHVTLFHVYSIVGFCLICAEMMQKCISPLLSVILEYQGTFCEVKDKQEEWQETLAFPVNH